MYFFVMHKTRALARVRNVESFAAFKFEMITL
jgi:hypothetical protein